MKVLRRKGLGVVPAIFCFGDILANEIVRQVAVDAGRRRVMAGLLPRVELRGHDMTIHTGGWIGAEIGKTLTVVEGKCADAEQDAAKGGQRLV